MSKFSDLCKKYFNYTDFYDILGISKCSSEKEVRKTYYKLSLNVYPDRVSDEDLKEEVTEKFKILSRIYFLLSNEEKRRICDQTGRIDDEDLEIFEDSEFDWLSYWKRTFNYKPFNKQDMRYYKHKYKGSEEEAKDLKMAYMNGKGNMDFILEYVPFSVTKEEPRYKSIIQKYIDSGELPVFDRFVNESPTNVIRRKRKYQRELSESITSTINKDETGESQSIREHRKAMNSSFDYNGSKGNSSPEGRQTKRRSKK